MAWADTQKPEDIELARRVECISCEELDGAEDSMIDEIGISEKCTKSERKCGHHCNHIWSHEECCWCGVDVPEQS